jgi:tetratricopeptide (TPR) repeat protein
MQNMEDNTKVQNKRPRKRLIIIAVVVMLAVVVSLPPVWSRVSYHSMEVYRTVKYWIKPPSEAVFVPSTPLPDTQPTVLSTSNPPELTNTQVPAPTPAPISLPPSVMLKGITCEQQLMNNCGPATLSMNLSYYDWGKDQEVVARVLKPNGKDVNVMPYELVDYVNNFTELKALWRVGGDLQTIKTLLHAGFPVMIEKSFEPFDIRYEGWMGHYNLVVGYNDARQALTVHDSYLMINTPWGLDIPREMWDTFEGFDYYYSDLEQAWRSFNFVFIVVYPPEEENEVLKALGPLVSEEQAYQIAYDRALLETSSLTDVRDKYFAWFNAGSSLVGLQDFVAASTAFDTAFGIYPEIELQYRPYRILWYSTGPYEAYYNAERYQDVINLASQTLSYMAEPVLEESYYWRALANHALGSTERAVADLRTSLIYHPGYTPSLTMLEQLGKTP